MARILVVEDDEILRNGIAFALTREGYQVKTAGSLSGMRGQLEGAPDLVILDVSLPDGDSRDFLPCLRKESQVPVIFLTARNTEKDMIAGFDAGADDYITKPFRPPPSAQNTGGAEPGAGTGTVRFIAGSLRYDFAGKELVIGENRVALTPTELRLLELFLNNRRQVLTREMLLARVWDDKENYVEEKAAGGEYQTASGKNRRGSG